MQTKREREAERMNIAAKLMELPPGKREQLVREYQKRAERAFSPETVRNLRLIIRHFREWLDDNGHSSDPPVSPQIVAEYVDYLGGKLRANTIETRLWGIAEYHKSQFLPSPCNHRLVELALKGVKRTYGAASRQAHALRKREVLRIIQGLGNSRIEVRDKAALWIASDSWCRASEIVAFRVRDIQAQEDGSSLLYVAKSKTDQYGEGAYAYLSREGTRAVLEWVKLAELGLGDPILTKAAKGGVKVPLNTATLSRLIRRCAGRKDVSAHSTRVGGVHDAFELGCDLSSIMVAGRWNSPEMPARYGRKILATQSAAAIVAKAIIAEKNSTATRPSD